MDAPTSLGLLFRRGKVIFCVSCPGGALFLHSRVLRGFSEHLRCVFQHRRVAVGDMVLLSQCSLITLLVVFYFAPHYGSF